jgi:hypothetical protein
MESRRVGDGGGETGRQRRERRQRKRESHTTDAEGVVVFEMRSDDAVWREGG